MTLPARLPTARLRGSTEPRLAPPVPAKSVLAEYEAAAAELGIKLMPWQRLAGRYITGRVRDRWAFREVAIVVARQNGKTTLLHPRILMGLRKGESILHTAQNRDLPRQTFLRVAGLVAGLPEIESIRKANGQEEIVATNGGRYKLVAPNSNVRGESADLVLIDEVREQHNQELMDAILPTTMARRDPQIIYLSNAGDDESVVLNELRRRRETDKRLAYLEWSAGPDRTLEDRDGWAEANPSVGVSYLTEENLEAFLAKGPPASFETENLCRWVVSMRPRLISDVAWQHARGPVERPRRPAMGISLDPSGKRASAVLAWRQTDGTIGCWVAADVTGDPIDTEAFGKDLLATARKVGVVRVAFDPWTDADLARYFRTAKPLIGREYAAASEKFVRVIEEGRLHWDDADPISYDLAWTSRKPHESGAWIAVKAREDRPITAALAAIRAIWLASEEKSAAPKVL